MVRISPNVSLSASFIVGERFFVKPDEAFRAVPPNAMRALTIELDDFGYERASEEAQRQGVSVEEVVTHAVMYYLADLDSGRAAARILKDADAAEGEAGTEGEPPKGRFRRSSDD